MVGAPTVAFDGRLQTVS